MEPVDVSAEPHEASISESESEEGSEGGNAFEREREELIARNKSILEGLGLSKAVKTLEKVASPENAVKKKKQERKPTGTCNLPVRRSGRETAAATRARMMEASLKLHGSGSEEGGSDSVDSYLSSSSDDGDDDSDDDEEEEEEGDEDEDAGANGDGDIVDGESEEEAGGIGEGQDMRPKKGRRGGDKAKLLEGNAPSVSGRSKLSRLEESGRSGMVGRAGAEEKGRVGRAGTGEGARRPSSNRPPQIGDLGRRLLEARSGKGQVEADRASGDLGREACPPWESGSRQQPVVQTHADVAGVLPHVPKKPQNAVGGLNPAVQEAVKRGEKAIQAEACQPRKKQKRPSNAKSGGTSGGTKKDVKVEPPTEDMVLRLFKQFSPDRKGWINRHAVVEQMMKIGMDVTDDLLDGMMMLMEALGARPNKFGFDHFQMLCSEIYS